MMDEMVQEILEDEVEYAETLKGQEMEQSGRRKRAIETIE
jgi:hypothetical protein